MRRQQIGGDHGEPGADRERGGSFAASAETQGEPEREGTVVALNLRLPSGQMAVQESASNPAAAIKAALDDMLQQLGKHKGQLRNTHDWSRRRNGSDRMQAQVPFEQTFAAVQVPTISSEDVRSYINTNLGRLERFIERELFFREAAGELLADSISKEEVIDEAVARALGEGEKPERLGLEPWLYRLALRSLQDLSRRDGDAHLRAAEGAHLRRPLRLGRCVDSAVVA